MLKRIALFLVIAVIGLAGLAAYDFYRKGVFSMPDLPEGAYYLSYNSGFRGILLDADVPDPSTGNDPKWARNLKFHNRTRHYLPLESDVPSWFQHSWSTCVAPTPNEQTKILSQISEEVRNSLSTARFEAFCTLDVDGEPLMRGLIFSVPRI